VNTNHYTILRVTRPRSRSTNHYYTTLHTTALHYSLPATTLHQYYAALPTITLHYSLPHYATLYYKLPSREIEVRRANQKCWLTRVKLLRVDVCVVHVVRGGVLGGAHMNGAHSRNPCYTLQTIFHTYTHTHTHTLTHTIHTPIRVRVDNTVFVRDYVPHIARRERIYYHGTRVVAHAFLHLHMCVHTRVSEASECENDETQQRGHGHASVHT
jgi:hypothetical protein